MIKDLLEDFLLLSEIIFGALARSYVGGNATNGVNVSGRVLKRELVDNISVRAVSVNGWL